MTVVAASAVASPFTVKKRSVELKCKYGFSWWLAYRQVPGVFVFSRSRRAASRSEAQVGAEPRKRSEAEPRRSGNFGRNDER